MSGLIIASEFLLLAGGAGLSTYYLRREMAKAEGSKSIVASDLTEKLLHLQAIYGYNEHSLVSISDKHRSWFDFETQSGISFTEHGKIWLVAGETLASEDNIENATHKFIRIAKQNKKLVAFLPTTEKFASMFASDELKAVKIGASPYFDLRTWNPRGDKAKKMRAGTNQARRAGVTIEKAEPHGIKFYEEVTELCKDWSRSRCAGVQFQWLFDLAPFRDVKSKKFFAARDTAGKMVGLLVASPIPAREGWYLEDVLRLQDAPRGMADLLVYETLKMLADDGAKLATLGTVPLGAGGDDLFTARKSFFEEKLLGFSRRRLESFYSFDGLRRFKAKFVPCWWEGEYALVPKGFCTSPRVAAAFVQAILPENFVKSAIHVPFWKNNEKDTRN